MTTDKITDEAQAALVERLSADIEYLDDTYVNSKTPPNDKSIDYEFGNHQLTLGDLKTILRALQRSDMQLPDLPDGWDLYCIGRNSSNEYWCELRHINSDKLSEIGCGINIRLAVLEAIKKIGESDES